MTLFKTHIDQQHIVAQLKLAQAVIDKQLSVANAITAFATGGQTSATQLAAAVNRITTVTTIADSVKLPAAVAGTWLGVTVINAATNSANVFPSTGDAINALGANAAYALAGGKTADFYCAVNGQWHAVLSA